MIVAELEIYHSRPIAPTRRIALGHRHLPVDNAPGAGGLLLAGVMAKNASDIDPELREDLVDVMERLSNGQRVVQPRVRHRFQTDTIGLTRSTQRLVSVNGRLDFDFGEERGRPVQLALGALYAAGQLGAEERRPVFEALAIGLLWNGPVDDHFISSIMGGRAANLVDLRSWNDPVAWALEILGLEGSADEQPTKRAVQKRFRLLLREAHPDHGGETDEAATRISELTEARRILHT
ncbi:MAG: J domain-containing protein [Acidimicrobiales bacterium]